MELLELCIILYFSSQKTSSHTRVGILNNPSSKIREDNTAIARGILTAFLTQNNSNLKSFLSKLSKEETAKSLAAGTKIAKFLVPVSAKSIRLFSFSLHMYFIVRRC